LKYIIIRITYNYHLLSKVKIYSFFLKHTHIEREEEQERKRNKREREQYDKNNEKNKKRRRTNECMCAHIYVDRQPTEKEKSSTEYVNREEKNST
jgi:hypothetical protein